jgi:hypothetical protein
MLIENALADAVRFFHIDALSSSVGFKVDFDIALLVLASCLYRLMGRRMRGYDDAQARQIFRDLIDMPADVARVAESLESPDNPPFPGIRQAQADDWRYCCANTRFRYRFIYIASKDGEW